MSQNNSPQPPKIPNPMGEFGIPKDSQIQAGVAPSGADNAELERRIQALEEKQINLNSDIIGLFETVSAVPSGTPANAFDQIKIYSNSTTYRLYWYDVTNQVWRYATGT